MPPVPSTPAAFGSTRRAGTAAAAQRLAEPPKLSPEADRMDKLDNDEFERQAAELLKPLATRPALIAADEVDYFRTTTRTGRGRLDALVATTNKRLDYWRQQNGGGAPFDPITPKDAEKAEAFFVKHGARLAGEPRRAPENPLTKPKPGADALIEKSKANLHADPEAVKPAPAAGPDPSLVLLTRIARASEQQATQIAGLVEEIKGLRAELAALPVATASGAPAAGAEAYTDFVMDVLAVGFDDKSGEKTYKARGPQYKTFGVRVWPEVLDELGLDEDKLHMGENKLPKALKVRAVLTADGKPRKVIGRAP